MCAECAILGVGRFRDHCAGSLVVVWIFDILVFKHLAPRIALVVPRNWEVFWGVGLMFLII